MSINQKELEKRIAEATTFDNKVEDERKLNALNEGLEDELTALLDEPVEEHLQDGIYQAKLNRYDVRQREDGRIAIMLWLDVKGHSKDLFKYQLMDSFNMFIGRNMKLYFKKQGHNPQTKRDILDLMQDNWFNIEYKNQDDEFEYQIKFLNK